MITKTPALVVQATGTDDVVAAVGFARDHGLALSVRGGGHNIAGSALADGAVRRASRDEHADLFWAVRGAGANLGVVTSFTFRVHQVGPTVYGGLIAWPFERAEEFLRAYRTITTEGPEELTAFLMIARAPAAPFVPTEWHHERICALSVCFSGDLRDAEAAVAPIRAIGDPILDLLHEQPYTELQSYLDATEPKGRHDYWRMEYASELSDGLLAGSHMPMMPHA